MKFCIRIKVATFSEATNVEEQANKNPIFLAVSLPMPGNTAMVLGPLEQFSKKRLGYNLRERNDTPSRYPR